MSKAARLRELLQSEAIVVAPGVYDGYSVRLVEQTGFKTAFITGAGVSNARLAVADVGIMGLADSVDACRHITRAVEVPIIADADTGYGNAVTVWHTVRYFEEAGAAGLFIEDQVTPKRCGHMPGKEIIDAAEMSAKVAAACEARRDDAFVVMARTDAIAVEGIDGAVRRGQAYAAAGADLIFADAVQSEEQIKRLVDSVPAPVAVNMGFGIRRRPTTPLLSIRRLQECGVKYVLLPRLLPAAAIMAMRQALRIMHDTIQTGEIADRPDLLVGIEDIWALMGQPEVRALEERFSRATEKAERSSAASSTIT